MQTNTKRTVKWIAVLLFAATLLLGANMAFRTSAQAASGNVGRTYYADELKNSELAQSFYRVIEEMAQNGDFDGGVKEYDLAGKGTLTQAQIAEYVEGNSPKIPVAFGAARDAFYMDHPDLFYIDVHKLYLSAGTQGGKYAAYIGTGNAENYYLANTVTDAAAVAAAKVKYETAVETAVAAAKAHSNDIVERIKFVNKYIIDKTEYDYGAYENAQRGVEYDGYVDTAYGALVNGKAMCGGYARAFKAILDRLDIPCVLIMGSGDSGKSSGELQKGVEAHMWNAVQIKGLWYAVDVTWNDGAVNPERYMLLGDDEFSRNHFPDGTISSSGFELSYPALRALNYGVDKDENGFAFKDSGKAGRIQFGYFDMPDDRGDTRMVLTLGVSYAEKNAGQLFTEGKYLAFGQTFELNGEVTEQWYSPIVAAQSMGILPTDFTLSDLEEIGIVADEYSIIQLNYQQKQIRVAIFGCAPARIDGVYTSEQITNANMIAVSTVYGNNAYGTYIPAPRVTQRIPDEYGMMKNFDTQDITLVYSENLVDSEGNPVGEDYAVQLAVYGSTSGEMSAYARVENVRWNAKKKTLTFRFTPSKMYQHNCEMYTFVPVNLKGEKSGKTPEPGGYYSYKMKQVICPRVFNDGRLYM
ncbi:MAG: hypothetical protein K2L51_04710, partial [Clostridiales bacterium]|nr:hypothetical protein [Clostridiales bacterium]